MIILRYTSKKELTAKVESAKVENGIGLSRYNLRYSETSMFGEEVNDNCKVTGSNRPSLTGIMVTKVTKKGIVRKRATEFFASLTIQNGYVIKVS